MDIPVSANYNLRATGKPPSPTGTCALMRVFSPRDRPESWPTRKQRITSAWTTPFSKLEWSLEWAAFLLSNWKLLEVLEYLSSLSVLAAVLFYFSESGDRTKQKHYQAWKVINTSQGKGGSGGRIEALQELNVDRVPLVGVDVSGAFLQGIHLGGARLLRSNFSVVDARNGAFRLSDFTDSDLHSSNFRQSDFYNARFVRCDLDDADFWGADLTEADLAQASLKGTDLRKTNLRNLHWRDIGSLTMANIYGVMNAPEGFVAWAVKKGAVEIESDDQWRLAQ
jgi:pentapeptide repeat protein